MKADCNGALHLMRRDLSLPNVQLIFLKSHFREQRIPIKQPSLTCVILPITYKTHVFNPPTHPTNQPTHSLSASV